MHYNSDYNLRALVHPWFWVWVYIYDYVHIFSLIDYLSQSYDSGLAFYKYFRQRKSSFGILILVCFLFWDSYKFVFEVSLFIATCNDNVQKKRQVERCVKNCAVKNAQLIEFFYSAFKTSKLLRRYDMVPAVWLKFTLSF